MFTTRRSVVRSHVSWTLLRLHHTRDRGSGVVLGHAHQGVRQQQGSVLFRHAVSEQLESVACRRLAGEVGIVSIGAAIRLPVSCPRWIPGVGQEQSLATDRFGLSRRISNATHALGARTRA